MLFVIPVVGFLAGIAVGNRPGPLELTGVAALPVGIIPRTSGAPWHGNPEHEDQ